MTTDAASEDLPFPFSHDSAEVRVRTEGSYERASIDGEHLFPDLDRLGEPELPVVHVRVVLPADARATAVSVSRSDRVTIDDDFLPRPIQEPGVVEGDPEFVAPNSGIYESNEAYPADPVLEWSTSFTRGIQVAHVAFTPLEYVGETQELHLYRESVLTVSYTAGDDTRELRQVRNRQRAVPRWTQRAWERDRFLESVVNPIGLEEFYREPLDDSDLLRTVRPEGGFRPTEKPSLEGPRVEHVIITDDLDLAGRTVGDLTGAFERLADWKTERGVPSVVRTVSWITEHYDGLDVAEKMRNFIIDTYELWGTDWVLLGGDVNVVPARRLIMQRRGSGEQPADAYFGCLDGNWNKDGDFAFGEHFSSHGFDEPDPTWEVFVGRAPVETIAEATNFVEKVLAYERRPGAFSGDGAWYESALLMGILTNSSDWGRNNNGMWVANEIYDRMNAERPGWDRRFYIEPILLLANHCAPEMQDSLESGPVDLSDVILWTDDPSHPSLPNGGTGTILGDLSAGVGLVHHYAHSSPYHEGAGAGEGLTAVPRDSTPACVAALRPLLSEHITSLPIRTLTNRDRYFVMFSTGSGVNSFFQESISEDWINAPAAGAVAYVGTPHSIGNPVGFVDRRFFQNLLTDGLVHVGQASALATEPFASTTAPENATYQLLGDPEMMVWTRRPEPLSMLVSDATGPLVGLGLGETSLLVAVGEAAGGPRVEGALVCVKQSDRVYAVRLTDALGQAVFPSLEFVTTDSVIVTASAPDKSPVQEMFGFAESGAFVTYVGHEETEVAEISNGNGVIDAGERVKLEVTLRNDGDQATAGPVSAELFVYGRVNMDLLFNDQTDHEDVFIGPQKVNPALGTGGRYGFPMRLTAIEEGGVPDVAPGEEGIFIWRDRDDANLWNVLAQRLIQPRRRVPLVKARGSITVPGGLDSVEEFSGFGTGPGGLEAGDVVDLVSPDRIDFRLDGSSDPDTLKFRAREIQWVSLVDSTATAPVLAPGDSVTVSFLVDVDADAPDRHEIAFEVHVTDGNLLDPSAGSSLFKVPVAAPDLVLARQRRVLVGFAAPDSTFKLHPLIVNAGSGVADSVRLTLSGAGVHNGSGSITVGELAPGAMAAPTSEWFNVSSSASGLDTLLLNLTTTNAPDGLGARTKSMEIDVSAPAGPSNLEAFVTTEEGVSLAWDPPDTASADHAGYHVYRRGANESAGSRELLNGANPATVAHFVDRTALRDSSYVYLVRSVDASGNESPGIETTTLTTWAPVHDGWPKRVARRGSPGPVRAVDFLTGDDDSLEIFVAGDMLHCWRADGTPCFSYNGNRPDLTAEAVAFDVELDPSYYFQQGRFWPAMAIADLDGNSSSQEIVLTSMTGLVTVLDYDANGDSLKVRWMRDVSEGTGRGAVHAAPTLFDVDDSGTLDVLVNSTRGRLYVFSRKGTAINAAGPDGCVDALLAGSVDPDSCACYDYGVGESWFSPVVIPGSNGARTILLAKSDGTMEAIDEDCEELWTYDLELVDKQVVSTPAVGNVSSGGTTNDIVFSSFGLNSQELARSRVHAVSEAGSLLVSWHVPPQFNFHEDKWIKSPVLADLTGDGRPEILIGRNEEKSVSTTTGERLQRMFVLNPDAPSSIQACSLVVGLPSRGVQDPDVWSQATVAKWGDDFRIFAASSNYGVMSWLWSDSLASCEGLPEDDKWKLHVTERVMGTPWVGDVDGDGYFNLIAADVGGKVWIWDLNEPYSAGKVEWGEHGHDARNTFTYVSGSSRVAAPPGGERVRLDQNFPNPFNPRTSIRYVLRERGEVQLSIFDVGGRLVRQLVDEAMPPGEHVIVWDGTNEAGHALPSGTYFYQLTLGDTRASRKLLLLK